MSKVLRPRSFSYITLRVLVQFCCGFRQSAVREKQIIIWDFFFVKSENEREKNEDEGFRCFLKWFSPQKKLYHMIPLPSGTKKMYMGSSYAKYPGKYNGVKTLKNITPKAVTCNKPGALLNTSLSVIKIMCFHVCIPH